ncbi:MAG: hypothetical protein WC146_02460 [Patescibacteria group bacterium]|jgi:hypothetical protein
MFSTSADVLNLVLSVCVVALTFFLCWSLFYFIASIRKIYKIVHRVEAGVDKAEEIIELLKRKINNSSTYFMILGEMAKKVIEFVQEKRDKKTEKKKKK